MKRGDFAFTLNKQAHCWALHTAGTFATWHLLPYHGAKLKPYQPVQDLAGLLCPYQVHIYRVGIGQGCLDRCPRNFVVRNALGGGGVKAKHFT